VYCNLSNAKVPIVPFRTLAAQHPFPFKPWNPAGAIGIMSPKISYPSDSSLHPRENAKSLLVLHAFGVLDFSISPPIRDQVAWWRRVIFRWGKKIASSVSSSWYFSVFSLF